MNQIWFGLVWINPKESKTQRNQKKQQNKNMFSRLVWTCLDPSSPHFFFVIFVFFGFGWLTTLGPISTIKGLCMDSKRPIWF